MLAPDEEPQDWDEAEDVDAEVVEEAPEDPGADRRFWFEHATGAGKTVAAVGFVEASRTGGVLILTHRRNLVDQFIGEISDRGYKERLCPPLLDGADHPYGPVTVETYQWFVRNAGRRLRRVLDRHLRRGAHRARREDQRLHPQLDRPGLHRHDRDRRADRAPRRRPLPDPDLALRPRPGGAPRRDRAPALHPDPARPRRADDRQGAAAPRRGRSGLRPGGAGRAARPGAVQRRGRRPLPVALSQRGRASSTPPASRTPRTSPRRCRRPGSTHAAVSGETPKRELPRSSPPSSAVRSTCSATRCCSPRAGTRPGRRSACTWRPTASRRVYQQRVGRVTRRNPGKEAGLVIDFVHPATTSDETDRHPAQPARPRRLPRRRDRRRPGASRARAPGASRAPGGPGHRPIPSGGSRSSSASCGGSRSRTSTTPSSTPGRRWPARA